MKKAPVPPIASARDLVKVLAWIAILAPTNLGPGPRCRLGAGLGGKIAESDFSVTEVPCTMYNGLHWHWGPH